MWSRWTPSSTSITKESKANLSIRLAVVIGLREARRRREYTVAAGALYARVVAAEAAVATRGLRRARAAR